MMFSAMVTMLLVAYAILAWRELKVALIVLTGLLPLYLLRFDIGPIPTTALEIMILILLAAWILKKPSLKQVTTPLQPVRAWMLAGLLLLAAACFGVVVAPDTFSALGIWKAYFIEPMIVFFLLITTLRKEDWQWIVRALALSALAVSIVAIVQYATGLGIPTPWDIERRVTSIFEYPNALGLYLAPIVTMLIVHIFSISSLKGEKSISRMDFSLRSKWNVLFTLSIIMGFIAIVLAKTEAALVAIPAALFVTFLLSNTPRRMKGRVAAEALVVLLLLLAFVPTVREKLFLQDASGQVRLSQWNETANMLLDHPAFGAGLNGYPHVVASYHTATLYEIYQYPHTLIFNIWSELGLLGLIAFFWLAWLVIASIRASTTQQLHNTTTLALFASLLAMTIHGLVDVPYFKNDLALLTWIFIAGIVLQTTKQSNQNNPA